MKNIKTDNARIGIMICGHKEYWPQFPGLKEDLIKNGEIFAEYVKNAGADISGCRFIDDLDDAYAFGKEMKAKDIDLLFVYQTTYVSSGRYMLGALAAGCPVIVAGLQKPLDLNHAYTLQQMAAAGSPCSVPEAYNALLRCGKTPVDVIFGMFGDAAVQNKINQWCMAAKATRSFKGKIFGYLGHSYEGMLDMNFDPTAITKQLGVHVRFVEMCELVNYVEQCTKKELDLKLEEINSVFERMGKSDDPTTRDIDEADIIWVARVAAGLEKLVKNNNLSGLAYYYMGENENIYERVASSLMIGNSLMTSKGVTMAGEADMKTCMAMYLTSSLGFGGTFSELCHVDFSEDILLVGHDGPHDIRISDRKPAIRGLNLYHGKKGHGVSVEFSIKHGPITMVGFGSDADGKLRLIVAQGESRPGWVPPIGNTLTRGYFGKNISKFVEDWSKTGNSHHQALAAGHCGDMVEKFGKLMNIEVIKVR